MVTEAISICLGVLAIILALWFERKNYRKSIYRKGSKIKTKWNNNKLEDFMDENDNVYNLSSIQSKISNIKLSKNASSFDQYENWSENARLIHTYNTMQLSLENFALTSTKNRNKINDIWMIFHQIESNMYENHTKNIELIQEKISSLPGKDSHFKFQKRGKDAT